MKKMKFIQPTWSNTQVNTRYWNYTNPSLQETLILEKEENKYQTHQISNLRYGLLAALALVGLGLTMTKFNNKSSFLQKKTSLENKIFSVEYPANEPIEDKFQITGLEHLNGYAATVFDGHGGWQCSEWAKSSLHTFLNQELSKLKTLEPSEDQVKQALITAFDQVENEFKRVALEAYRMNCTKLGGAGSCCLCTVVINKKLYVANIGDCGGVLLEKQENGEYKSVKMNTQQNLETEEEREKLKLQFPNDPDIVAQKSPGGSWYVKRILMPTRAFGDFDLKWPEFNNPKNYPKTHGFSSRIEPWNGPYITHVPEIRVYDIKDDYTGYILASDGLWDEMSIEEVALKYAEDDTVDPQVFIKRLMKDALTTAASKEDLTYENLLDLSQGRKRRTVHDDITILFVTLE